AKRRAQQGEAPRRRDGGVRGLRDRRGPSRSHLRGGRRQQGADVRLVLLEGGSLRRGVLPAPAPDRGRRPVHAPRPARLRGRAVRLLPDRPRARTARRLEPPRARPGRRPARRAPRRPQARGHQAGAGRRQNRSGHPARRGLRARDRAGRDLVAGQRDVHRVPAGRPSRPPAAPPGPARCRAPCAGAV
ncbi:MAG: Transcriptional regulator, AcrR family, partial [uncultured Solirubrobacteraceae bacterium]